MKITKWLRKRLELLAPSSEPIFTWFRCKWRTCSRLCPNRRVLCGCRLARGNLWTRSAKTWGRWLSNEPYWSRSRGDWLLFLLSLTTKLPAIKPFNYLFWPLEACWRGRSQLLRRLSRYARVLLLGLFWCVSTWWCRIGCLAWLRPWGSLSLCWGRSRGYRSIGWVYRVGSKGEPRRWRFWLHRCELWLYCLLLVFLTSGDLKLSRLCLGRWHSIRRWDRCWGRWYGLLLSLSSF